MICVSVNISSDEWLRIQQAASGQFPNESLSRSEIIRRYALAGIQALGKQSPGELERTAHEFRASQAAPDQRLRS